MSDIRTGDWMQTASGREFWPLDPRPEEVYIGDIAHALSNLCRYAGHTRAFYSVAQHSVLVARNLPDELRLWGLLHDAPEAYVVDIPRPLKPFLTGYATIEARVMGCIQKRFGLSDPMPKEVKRVDAAILGDEAVALMMPPPRPWRLAEPRPGIAIHPWPQERAYREFMAEFERCAPPFGAGRPRWDASQ